MEPGAAAWSGNSICVVLNSEELHREAAASPCSLHVLLTTIGAETKVVQVA